MFICAHASSHQRALDTEARRKEDMSLHCAYRLASRAHQALEVVSLLARVQKDYVSPLSYPKYTRTEYLYIPMYRHTYMRLRISVIA